MVLLLILVAITLLMAGFLVAWCAFPQLRPRIEAPKYQVLRWDQPASGGACPRRL